MRRLRAACLGLCLSLAACSSSAGGAGVVLAKGWALTSIGVRALGLCDDHPPALIRAIAGADQTEAEGELDGGKVDAVAVVDAPGAEVSTISGDR